MTPSATTGPKQVAVNDIGSSDDFLAEVEKTLKFFNDGDLIEGTVVKIDRDEVLLDVGYKTEGVIPSRELSIKHDVDPNEVVTVGDPIEALVLQKEDKEGSPDSLQEARPIRARLGRCREDQGRRRRRHRNRHRGGQGWAHRRHWSAWLPPRIAD